MLMCWVQTWISKLKTKKRGKSKKSPQDDQGDSGLQQADIVAEAKKLLLEVVDSAAAVMSSLEQSLQVQEDDHLSLIGTSIFAHISSARD